DVDGSYVLVIQAIRLSTPPKSQPRLGKPWFDSECFNSRRCALQALALARPFSYMRPLYSVLRKNFKNLCAQKQLRYLEWKEERFIEEAEAHPYKWSQLRGTHSSCPIRMHKWVGHLSSLYQRNPSPVPNVVLQRAHRALTALNKPFGSAEIEASVNSAPNGKAACPDALAYEHVKLSLPALMPY